MMKLTNTSATCPVRVRRVSQDELKRILSKTRNKCAPLSIHMTHSFSNKQIAEQSFFPFSQQKFQTKTKLIFVRWSWLLIIPFALILLGTMIASVMIILRTTQLTITTTQTITTTTSTTTTTSSSTSTTATTTTTTTTSSSSTATSSTSSTTITTQLDSRSVNSIPSRIWTKSSYSYYVTKSASVTLNFRFLTDNYYAWYLDDVAVQNAASTEMLTNGDLENASSLFGWTSSCSLCGLYCGLPTNGCHLSNRCFFDQCSSQITSISQTFSATTDQMYNTTYWLYLDHYMSWTNLLAVNMTIAIS